MGPQTHGVVGSQTHGRDPLRLEDYRVDARELLLATLWINVLSLALPILTLQVYDRILPHPGTGTFAVLVTGVCAAIALEAVLRLVRSYLLLRNGASYEHRLSCLAMGRILNARLGSTNSSGIGEQLNRVSSIATLKDFHSGYALTVLAELAFVPIFLCVIAYLYPPVAVVAGLVLLVFALLSLVVGVGVRKAIEARETANDTRFNFLIEVLDGIRTVKTLALERLMARRYDALQARSTQANFNAAQRTGALITLSAVFSHAMVAAVVGFGAYAVLGGEITAGALVATIVLSARTMPPMQRALALWARYQDYRRARTLLRAVCSAPQQVVEGPASPLPRQRDGQVQLKGVHFSLRGVTVAKGLDLSLRRGDTVAITGGDAQQRSLLLALIAGIYPPNEGSVEIDRLPIASYSSLELTRHVGLVRASAPVFRGTIRDNITAFGQHNVALAREVSALLGIDKEVAALASGLDTMLTGGATENISPGLAQRITIARALAPKPRIILFDNADRALDRSGYARLYSVLARLKGRITMVITSDDANVRGLADRTLLLEDGRLRPVGARSADDGVRANAQLPL